MESQSVTPDRRTRKRLVTRQGISDTATRLFLEKGFDHVTIDEIADAADVGRMTVFNHFPRKEDLFFDRDEAGRELLREALRSRDPRVVPVEALRRFVHGLVDQRSPYVRFTAGSRLFVTAIAGSENLKARARAIRDEVALLIATAMAEGVGRDAADSAAHLAANLLASTWSVAYIQAHRLYRETDDDGKARAFFLAVFDKGIAGIRAAVAGTPYA